MGLEMPEASRASWHASSTAKRVIAGLGLRRKIAHLHVFGHALTKRCHGELLCEMECAASSVSMISQRNSTGKDRALDLGILRNCFRRREVSVLPTAQRFSTTHHMWLATYDTGNPHVRFDEGRGRRASASLPLLLYFPFRLFRLTVETADKRDLAPVILHVLSTGSLDVTWETQQPVVRESADHNRRRR
jgi:hypothetical protein